MHHSRVPARSLNNVVRVERARHRKDGVRLMTHKAEAAARAEASSRKTDPFGLSLLAVIVLVMTAWIGGLIWAAMAFMTWLVS